MAVIVKCGSCKTNFRVRDEFAGKQIQCPRCSKPLLVDGERVPNHDVFISYSHEDKNVADAVCVALEAKGIRCWIAPRDIAAGASWAGTIIDAIEDARVMVLIYSQSANLSPQVVREIGRAVSKGAVIAPFCVEDAPMSKEMEFFLSASQWFDAMNGATESNLERFASMVRSLMSAKYEGQRSEPPSRPSPGPAAQPASGPAGRTRRLYLLLSVLAGVAILVVAMVSAVVLAILYPSGDVAPTRPEAPSAPASTTASKDTQKVQPPRPAAPSSRAVAAPDGPITLDLGGNITMTLVLIRPGTFMMGLPDSEEGHDADEDPQHKVTISKPFYMGVTEVTQAQYKAVTGTDPSKYDGPTNPVDMVSWEDAMDFCRTLSERTGRDVRLPTEAEWEYACRAGTGTRFYFGDSDSALAEYAWWETNSNGRTHPVGRKKPNAWGLYDMHGNVLEWCADWYGKPPRGASTDPQGAASGRRRVLHGGSWYDNAISCSAGNRFGGPLNYHAPICGFRVVVSGSAP